MRARQAARPVGKQQLRVAMGLPESAQHVKGNIGQGNQPVAVAFGVTNVHTVAISINVTHLQCQAFAQAQAHAVQSEEKYPVAQNAGV